MAVGLHNYIFLMICFSFVLFVAFLWTAVFFWFFFFVCFLLWVKSIWEISQLPEMSLRSFLEMFCRWKSCLVTCLGKLFSGQDGGILLYIYMCVCLHTYTKTGGGACKEVPINGIKVKWVLSSVANDVSRPLDRHCRCFCRFSLQRRPCVQHLSVVHCCHILTAF